MKNISEFAIAFLFLMALTICYFHYVSVHNPPPPPTIQEYLIEREQLFHTKWSNCVWDSSREKLIELRKLYQLEDMMLYKHNIISDDDLLQLRHIEDKIDLSNRVEL